MAPRHFHYSRFDLAINALAKLLDAITIAATLLIMEYLYLGRPAQTGYVILAVASSLGFVIVGEFACLYKPWRGETPESERQAVVFAWTAIMLLVLALTYAGKISDYYSRATIFIWFFVAPVLLLTWRRIGRALAIRFYINGQTFQRAVVWGGGKLATQVVRLIEETPWLGVRLVGQIGTPVAIQDIAGEVLAKHYEESLSDLVTRVRNREIEIVYIALSLVDSNQANLIIERLADTTASIYWVPDISATHLMNGRWTSIGNMPVISIFETPFWGAYGWMKRIEDIILASLILVTIFVPMVLIAIGVKLSSPGPVLFKQRRYGVDGKEIRVWKFRTMSVIEDGNNIPQATRNDARVTRFGAFLRRTSLDELPQFFNVIMGEMSVVGPRPHAVAHNEYYRRQIQGYMLRHKIKPGITGWAQINGWRGETDVLDKMEQRVKHDLWYLRNWSVGLDLKIIVLTIFRSFIGARAY